MTRLLHAFFLAAGLFSAVRAGAVVFYQTGSLTHNTSAPAGSQATPWQYQGRWQGFITVPIGPHHFVSAGHIGGAVGDVFTYQGIEYTTVEKHSQPGHELVIWTVNGTFPSWAPLYRGTGEVDQECFFFGIGSGRGAEVKVGNALRGWQWGPGPASPQWGLNRIDSIASGGANFGDLLYATFDSGAGPEEAQLAGGDSSAPIFLWDGSQWALAGVAYAVDGPFNTSSSGPGFQAALYNVRGLYYGGEGNWSLMSFSLPSGFYATRVSSHLAWIDSLVPAEDPTDIPSLGVSGATLLGAALILGGARRLGAKPGHLR